MNSLEISFAVHFLIQLNKVKSIHLGNIFVLAYNIAKIRINNFEGVYVNVCIYCCFKGGTAASALEEIIEQEETNVPLASAAATHTQEEERDFSKSVDVSLPSPSSDTDIPSTISMESNGEGQSQELSSDDKYEL